MKSTPVAKLFPEGFVKNMLNIFFGGLMGRYDLATHQLVNFAFNDGYTGAAGIAIAPIQNGQCGVCHIQVPVGVVSAVRTRKNETTYCPSCGRVLFGG